MSSRRRPLHTCGVAILSIAHIAYSRFQDFNGPIGSMARKISRLAKFPIPVIYALQYQWLAMLSFADDLILAIENTVETVFPPSNRLFNTIDKLIQIVETLPGKLDDVLRDLPAIFHRCSLLDWAVIQVISWLNLWISILIQSGFGHATEKEIIIDSNSNEFLTESSSGNQPVESSAQVPAEPESSEPRTNIVNKTTVNSDVMKTSYKEAVVKGKREANGSKDGSSKSSSSKEEKETKVNTQNEDDGTMEETEKQDVSGEEAGKRGELTASKSDESVIRSDPILELFESGWAMKPTKERKAGWLSRSVSYTS